ncbi:hypothetical protein [Xenorhabdus sp. KJ12.1]|uniref:hypothetical protein n=1 Tax=Xenorhabdus sp. KJ12.1 TaxID=1851571 RepID=UPI000C043FD8|nr:hypothetical protein [Xenorhabdus sp. KJ12.1]PHM72245.1 hypothetical protein Xekj_00523 [Xenorhabdus sp. KJ12.1]
MTKIDAEISLELLNKYWDELSNIMVENCHETDDLCTVEPFLHFSRGTNVIDIWHWFEDQTPDFHISKMLY